MQRWRSGRTRTIRNRVMQECIQGFKSLSLRQLSKGFPPFYGSPFFVPFLDYTIFSQVRKERKFCHFFAFEIVHDMRIDFKGKRGRRVPDKLLTYIYVDTAFATPCNKRMPQFVQVVTAA